MESGVHSGSLLGKRLLEEEDQTIIVKTILSKQF
jgi:hypothetical protein